MLVVGISVRKRKRRDYLDILLENAFICLFMLVSVRSQGVGYGKIVPIPAGSRAQYQRINHAGPNTYKFGYDTGTGPSQSFREEERDTSGVVRGRYGFINPLGALHIVEYFADDTGFHIVEVLNLEPARKPPPSTTTSTTTTTTTTTTPVPEPQEVTKEVRPLPPFSGPLPPFVRLSRTNSRRTMNK